MNEIYNWIQSNWYELGSLLFQGAIVLTLGWFGRTALRTMRASQEQVGALLKLTLSDASADRSQLGGFAQRTAPSAPALAAGEGEEIRPSLVGGAWRGVGGWLQAPMGSGVAPWRKVIKWLQAPAGS